MNAFLHMLAVTDKTFLLPRGNSNLAPDVDWAWNIILYTTGLFFCIVVGAMTFFVIRYRRRTPNDKTSEITHNTPLEIAWTVIPLIIVMGFFYVGFKGFLVYDTPASNSMVVNVEARKWQFTFTYPNGAQDGELYVELNKPVQLNLHSIDVLHALYMPTFRTQRNLVPWRQTTIWFIPEEVSPQEGFPIFCTQYCGDGHSKMFSHVHVLDTASYVQKMTELANPFKKKDPVTGKSHWVPYVELGHTLYSQMGCATCHSVEPKDATSTAGTGPPWVGLWKRDHPEFAYTEDKSQTSLMANEDDAKWEAYLTESILHPDVKLVRFQGKNYPNVMPNFGSQLSGNVSNDEKRRAIIAYIKSLGNTGWKEEPNPKDNPALFDADNPTLFDKDHNPVHPESLLGMQAATAPATSSQPGSR